MGCWETKLSDESGLASWDEGEEGNLKVRMLSLPSCSFWT